MEYTGTAKSVMIKIADAAGKIVYSEHVPATGVIPVQLNFAAGQYAITIADDVNVVTRKIMKY